MTKDQIIRWRKAIRDDGKKVSQVRAAELLGIHVDTYRNYERGVRRGTAAKGAGDPVTIPLYISLACAAIQLGLRDYPHI